MASSSFIPSATAQEIFPEGVIFDPADEQLLFYYLVGKTYGLTDGKGFSFIKEIELYDCEPSTLYSLAPDSGHDKRFFFTRLRKKNQNGRNVNRQAAGGFWKKTGPPSFFKDKSSGEPVATKTSLVYRKKDQMTSTTVKTQWLMKEYMLSESEQPNQDLTPWTLCVVYQYKSDRES